MKEKEIDLVELLSVIKNNLLKSIFLGILISIIFALFSMFLIKPKYESKSSLIVNSNESENNPQQALNDIQLNQKLVNTYTEILKTRGIADRVIDNLDLNIDYEDFRDMVSISTKQNTEIFEITVVDTNPERAADIVNETSNVFKESIVNIMNIDNVQILDKGLVNNDPISPNIFKNAVIGFFLGFIISNLIYLILELSDSRIKSVEDAKEYFDIPVLGQVPDKKKVD